MARIKDKKKIPIKDVPNVEDYLVGSDSEDGGKTANFKIGAIRGGDNMTDAAVKVAYENNPDTNEFSDAEKSKLSGLSNTSIYDSDGTVGTGVTRTVAVDGTLKFQNASFYGINFSQPQFSILHPDLVFLGSDNSLSLKNGFPATLDGSYGIKFRIGSGGVPASPTVGQVLAAKDTDGDLEWVNAPTGGLVASDIDTLAELNAIVTDATLIDTADARLSDARTPTAHTHVEADITDLGTYSTDIHANIIALNAVTGTNTGDQVIPVTGVDFDPVGTDNSDNNAVNTLYSGLATSKQDTLVSATNIKTINGTTILGSGDLVVDGGATGSDVAYDVITWDANTDVPTKNVISDLYENKTFKVDTDGALVPIVPIYWQGTQAEFTTKFGATAPPNYFTVVPDANPPAIEGTDIASTGEVGGTKYLREDGDGTSSWQPIVGGGDVTKVGTAFENQVAIWKTDGSIEGLGGLTFDDVTTNALNVGLGADNQGTIKIGGNAMLSSNDANVSSLFNGSLIKTGTDLAFTGNITSAGTINGATITSGTLNGTVTGTNTGDNAVNTLYSGLVSYVDILKEDLAVSSASFDIDWSKNTHYYELTGITTFLTQSNLPPAGQSKTITIHITGDFALTLPTAWNNINGAYAGATLNTIVVEYVAISTTPFYRVEIITTPV